LLLKFAYQELLDEKRFNNVTSTTIYNYKLFLGEFIDYCSQKELIYVEDVTKGHIKEYLKEGLSRGNKPLTFNSRLQRIKSFFIFMVECGVIKDSENPAKHIPRQKEDVSIDVFTDAQIKQMLNHYRRKARDRRQVYCAYRNYVILTTLLSTGIRKGELVRLSWSDIDLYNKNMKVSGKNRIKQTIPITDDLVKELSLFKDFQNNYFKHKVNRPVDVFTNKDGTRALSLNGVSCIFKNLGRDLQFKDVRVSAHTCRHTYASHLAASGVNAFKIQKLLRHKDISQTMRYVNLYGDELRGDNDTYNPLKHIDL